MENIQALGNGSTWTQTCMHQQQKEAKLAPSFSYHKQAESVQSYQMAEWQNTEQIETNN